MIPTIAILLGVVAVVLGVLLRKRTTTLSALRHETDLARERLERKVETAKSREEQSLQALGETQAELDATRDLLEAARAHAEDLNTEVEAADQLADSQAAELASMAIESEELRRKTAVAELDVKVAQKQADELAQRVAALEGDPAAATHPSSSANPAAANGADAAALWRLELVRSERTWRYGVALLPDEASPFSTSADPLKLAIETEASALRDEVGAFITTDVEDGLSDEPATSLLVLRLAQEVLAAASRLDAPTVMAARRSAEGIELEVATEDGELLDLDLADLVSQSLGCFQRAKAEGCRIHLQL